MGKKNKENQLVIQAKEYLTAVSKHKEKEVLSKLPNLKLENIKDAIEKLASFLNGVLELEGGMKLKSGKELNLSVKLDGDNIIITFLDPVPSVEYHYIITLSSKVLNIKANTNQVEIELNGFPNPKFKVIS